MVKTSKGDAYFKTEVISDPYLEDTMQGTVNENGIPIRIHQVQPLGIRNQFLTYSFNNITVETPIIDQFESLNTALPDHVSDNDYRNSIQNPADYDYWNSPNENYDLSEPDWLREQREAVALFDSRNMQRLEEFGDIQDVSIETAGEIISETSLFGQESNDISTFTNHSGGAIGSDTAWDTIGREFGMTNNKHYYFEGYKTPNGNTSIPISLKNEADVKLKEANKTLGRKFPTSKEYVNNLLRRNWWQVKNSDSIFAISTITDNKVDGGTGWAVHMAIAENKPVYVFDQKINKWFTWSNNKFVEVDTPVLTKNFAGIGTREINENGKQAIRDVYEKTTSIQITPQQKQQAQQRNSAGEIVSETSLFDSNVLIEQVGKEKIEEYKNKCKNNYD